MVCTTCIILYYNIIYLLSLIWVISQLIISDQKCQFRGGATGGGGRAAGGQLPPMIFRFCCCCFACQLRGQSYTLMLIIPLPHYIHNFFRSEKMCRSPSLPLPPDWPLSGLATQHWDILPPQGKNPGAAPASSHKKTCRLRDSSNIEVFVRHWY